MSQVKLTADSGGGTTSLKAPSATTSNADVVLKLPVADGSANQVLKTDGSGQLSFTSNAGTTINNNADNRVITGSGTASTLNGESSLTYGGTELLISNSSPSVKLNDTDNSGVVDINNVGGVAVFQSTGDTLFETNASERMRIASDGRITQKGGDLIIDNTNNGYGGLRIVDDSGGEYTVNYIAGRNSGATAHVFKINGRTQNQSPWANSGSDSECARISQQGLAFNGDTAAANCLDDYEEGTWTPAVDTTYVSGTPTYHGQTGTYTKIGNRVFINGNCHINSISFSNNSQIFKITGLPFNGATSSGGAAGTTGSTVFQQLEWVGASNSSYGTNNDVVISPSVNSSNKIVFKICSQDKYYVSELKNEGVDGNQALFRFSFFYQTA